ncbi:MAG: winged helix-turn-helix domain-containing protein [bacterium]|nr:winged helix-turn-helix domain-containing protein [bacterium]
MRRLKPDQARRAALGAQGFNRQAPAGRVDRRHFRRVFDDIGLLQLDSVNVLERSHYLPVFARLGDYSKSDLDGYTVGSGEVFEYWGHEASLLPVELYPYFRHRMDSHQPWRRVRKLMDDHPGYIETIYEEIAERGPLTVGDLADPGDRKGNWWGWGNGKVALEWLFGSGRITAYRTKNFARVYDLPERVITADHRETEPIPRAEAYRHLLALSARHHALGTAADLADYYRLHLPTARPILADMAARRELVEVDVAGWKGPVYADPNMAVPRSISTSALLSPFDPVVWARDRAERLFGFRYRIEIYVPKPKRIHGYYVLPYLIDDTLVGRVDLKTDRQAGVLRVQGAYVEDGQDVVRVGKAMVQDLESMAAWLGMDRLVRPRRGNLKLP